MTKLQLCGEKETNFSLRRIWSGAEVQRSLMEEQQPYASHQD